VEGVSAPAYSQAKAQLAGAPKSWLVTGVAGFIGSHLLEALLKLNQTVTGLDNFSMGHARNLEQVRQLVGVEQWKRFRLIEGDITNLETCRQAVAGVHCVLHQAALGSVPRSLAEPIQTHQTNVSGFLNVIAAARDANAERFVFASSSAVYGDDPDLPKIESKTGKPLSPYAATKTINELYAEVFARAYGFPYIGLRYFNVFGQRQDPAGAYAAVIPQWIARLLSGEPVYINGDGQTSRDFCFVADVVQANLLAATIRDAAALNQLFNVARGERTTLNELFDLIQGRLRRANPSLPEHKPTYRDFRPGDVPHSLADISKARELLGYEPTHSVAQGLELAMDWYSRT
jgi:UDP-N-acetylglucosamine/UDP-N-acetylgalactosamine 4-epimerase